MAKQTVFKPSMPPATAFVNFTSIQYWIAPAIMPIIKPSNLTFLFAYGESTYKAPGAIDPDAITLLLPQVKINVKNADICSGIMINLL